MAEKRSNTTSSRTSKVKKVVLPSKAIVSAAGGPLKGFVEFIRTQGVIGLAIGLVLGGAVSVLVKSLVDNVVMPPVGLLLGSADGLKGLSVSIGGGAKPAVIHYGTFLNDLINFIVIAFVIYFVFNLLLSKLDKKKS